MDHKIVEKDEFFVIGMPIKVSLKEPNYPARLKDSWNAFVPRLQEIKNRSGDLFYGLCNVAEGIEGDDCSFEHISGVEVKDDGFVPEGMKLQKVPAAKYFVVTHKGNISKVGETYCALEEEFKKLNLVEDKSKIFFELYDDRFHEDSDDSEHDIYTALK